MQKPTTISCQRRSWPGLWLGFPAIIQSKKEKYLRLAKKKIGKKNDHSDAVSGPIEHGEPENSKKREEEKRTFKPPRRSESKWRIITSVSLARAGWMVCSCGGSGLEALELLLEASVNDQNKTTEAVSQIARLAFRYSNSTMGDCGPTDRSNRLGIPRLARIRSLWLAKHRQDVAVPSAAGANRSIITSPAYCFARALLIVASAPIWRLAIPDISS